MPQNMRTAISRVKHFHPPGDFADHICMVHSRALNLTRIRKAKGLTQIDLAEAMGVTQSTVSRMERGDEGCALELFGRAATVLGVSLEDMFSEDRSAAEAELVSFFRSLPSDRQRRWLELAKVASGLLP